MTGSMRVVQRSPRLPKSLGNGDHGRHARAPRCRASRVRVSSGRCRTCRRAFCGAKFRRMPGRDMIHVVVASGSVPCRRRGSGCGSAANGRRGRAQRPDADDQRRDRQSRVKRSRAVRGVAKSEGGPRSAGIARRANTPVTASAADTTPSATRSVVSGGSDAVASTWQHADDERPGAAWSALTTDLLPSAESDCCDE